MNKSKLRNLDNFLRARNEQKQAEESEKIALEELEVNKNEQTELANTKQQLELLKESLSAEKTGRDYYEKIKRNAEMQIAPIEKTLEANGLSKEELLNNPEYQDLEETNALSVATANLAAPVIINLETRKAKQVILEDEAYTIRYPIFSGQQDVAKLAVA